MDSGLLFYWLLWVFRVVKKFPVSCFRNTDDCLNTKHKLYSPFNLVFLYELLLIYFVFHIIFCQFKAVQKVTGAVKAAVWFYGYQLLNFIRV